MTAEAQDRLVRRLVDMIEQNREDIIDLEEDGIDGAEVVVCSYGISARVSRIAVEQARAEGIRVGGFAVGGADVAILDHAQSEDAARTHLVFFEFAVADPEVRPSNYEYVQIEVEEMLGERRERVKVLPAPTALSTPIVPPWASAAKRQKASPSPVEKRRCSRLSRA